MNGYPVDFIGPGVNAAVSAACIHDMMTIFISLGLINPVFFCKSSYDAIYYRFVEILYLHFALVLSWRRAAQLH